MKSKLLFFATLFVASACFAQDVKKKIDQQSKDPKTKENAAKADVFIHKKTIMDSTVEYRSANVPTKKVSATTHVKKKKKIKKDTKK